MSDGFSAHLRSACLKVSLRDLTFDHAPPRANSKRGTCFSLLLRVKTLAHIHICGASIFDVLTRYDQHAGSGGFLTLQPAFTSYLRRVQMPSVCDGGRVQNIEVVMHSSPVWSLLRGTHLNSPRHCPGFPLTLCCAVMIINGSTKLNKTETLRTIQ